VIRVIPDFRKAKAYWTHRTSKTPDYIVVPMSDGSCLRFNPEIKLPAPVFRDKLDRFDEVIGYRRSDNHE